jgi:CheY-like chemotaxis protein
MATVKSGPILVVEDDPPLREQIRELLETDGHEVVEAADGLEALGHLRGPQRIGLVVLDMNLPVVSGWEVLARMRSDDSLSDTPVIILSARPVADAVGTPPVFRKPLEPDAFLEAVRTYRR